MLGNLHMDKSLNILNRPKIVMFFSGENNWMDSFGLKRTEYVAILTGRFTSLARQQAMFFVQISKVRHNKIWWNSPINHQK